MVNLIYTLKKNKNIIANYKDSKLKNKRFFFDNIDKLNIDEDSYYLENEENFHYFSKLTSIELENTRKLTIKDIEKKMEDILEDPALKGKRLIFYNISYIFVDRKEEEYLMGIEWKKFVFQINIVLMERQETNKIISQIWIIDNLKVYPKSFFLLSRLYKKLKWADYYLLYLWNKEVKIIDIKNGFYSNIEHINTWLDDLKKILENTFPDLNFMKSIDSINEFHKNLYQKELNKFTDIISMFIKENAPSNKNILLIWDIWAYPLLVDWLSNSCKQAIMPFRSKDIKGVKSHDIHLNCLGKIKSF